MRGGAGGLFSGGPKKSPSVFAPPSALLPAPWPRHSRSFFHKRRGAKDLEEPSALLDFPSSGNRQRRWSDFFGVDPKKVPLF